MTPLEFLDGVVRPNAEEFEREFGSIRRAQNAVAAVDALAARIFHAAKPPIGARDDSAYRQQLSDANPDFRLLRDLAKANKHYVLDRHNPAVTSAAQVEVKSLGWGEQRWDEGRWDSPPQVYVRLDNGDLRAVDYLVRAAIVVLEAEMVAHGLA